MDDPERKLQEALEALAGAPVAERQQRAFDLLVAALVETFQLQPDEVAILPLSPDGEMLRFAYPPELAAGGSNAFPVRLPSLAGRVAAGEGSVLSNRVQEEPHLAFYERVPARGIAPTAIQKLVAVSLQGPGTRILGVVEISRRGKSPEEAGPDFDGDDRERVERLVAAVASTLATGVEGG